MSEKKILEKHPPLTSEEVEQKLKEQKQLGQEIQAMEVDYEKRLVKYFDETVPIISEDGIVLAEMRYPSYDELISMVPPELRKYYNKQQEVPPELEEKYSEIHFDVMATLIVNPKKNADWWKKNASLKFINLFNMLLAKIVNESSEQAENFRIPRKV